MRASTSASHALGSAPASFAVSMSVNMTAARWPPSSEPQKVQLRLAYGDAPDRALGGIVRQADAAVFEEARKHLPTIEGVVDGLGKWPLGRELPALGAQPGFEALDERF